MCVLIASVRADERERIAQAIEAAARHPIIGDADWHTGVRYAARIARGGVDG